MTSWLHNLLSYCPVSLLPFAAKFLFFFLQQNFLKELSNTSCVIQSWTSFNHDFIPNISQQSFLRSPCPACWGIQQSQSADLWLPSSTCDGDSPAPHNTSFSWAAWMPAITLHSVSLCSQICLNSLTLPLSPPLSPPIYYLWVFSSSLSPRAL